MTDRINAYGKYSACITRSWRVQKFTISRVVGSRVTTVVGDAGACA